MRGFEGALRALFVAATVLVVAGCPAPEEKCGDVVCAEGDACIDAVCVSAKCVLDDGSAKKCPAGRGCNPTTGACENLCVGVVCEGDLRCKPDTGKCTDLCATVTCSNPTQRCYADSGRCESKCKTGTCAADEACEPTTGECSKRCETATKPAGESECAAGLKCDANTGDCVLRCTGVTCPGGVASSRYAQFCDPATGTCKSGKPPAGTVGAACGDVSDCDKVAVVEGQDADCFTDLDGDGAADFPQGYCTATCGADLACPAGSYCIDGLGCLDKCKASAECQNDTYTCVEATNIVDTADPGEFVCLPKILMGLVCDHTDPSTCSPIGGDCADSGDCVDGAYCIGEVDQAGEFSGFVGGMCLAQVRSTDNCGPGAVNLQVDSANPQSTICFRTCTPGTVGTCNRGESCLDLGQGVAICFLADCGVDSECATAGCTATDKSACGSGQACENIDSASGQGTCVTTDKCDGANPCAGGEACSNGLCRPQYCDAALGQCRPADCTTTPTDSCEASGAACNPATGRCERACNRDETCSGGIDGPPGAVCADGFCVTACTKWNETDVCASTEACDLLTGHCEPKCVDDAGCGTDRICETTSGRCLPRCDAATAPTACTSSQVCNSDTGRCQTKCTTANEATVCGSTKRCQLWSGFCLGDCRTDAAVCEGAACSVKGSGSTEYGYCAADCSTDAACGTEPNGFRLKCLGTTGKHCGLVECSDTAPCASASDTCVEGHCKLAQ